MANGEKRLSLHPIPQATQYNRVVVYGLGAAGILVVATYLTVMSSRGKRAQWDEDTRLTTYNRPLMTEAEKPAPLPPPPPAPVMPTQVYPEPVPTPAPPPPQAASQPNPDVIRRKEALLKAMSAKVLVEGFNADRGQQKVHPMTAAAPAMQSAPYAAMHHPWPLSEMSPQQRGGWHGTQPPSLVGRTQQFWQQDSHATQDQYLAASVQAPRSPYQVNAGTIIPATLMQAITSDLEGTVTALVSSDVYDSVTGRFLLIPQGSRIFGMYDADLQANQPRLHLAFKTIYFPNGASLSLAGMPGADQRGLSGLSDKVNRHFFQRYGTAAILSLITAGISMATYGNGGGHYYTYEPEQAAMQGAGQVLGRAVAEDLRKAMSIRPTVNVREAYPFTMTVTQDVTFPGPYPFGGVQ